MIGVLGTLAEAWDEVRVHKTRVLLSLVGVFLAVFAMTSVTALG
jgi:putative ABC transport system permease protein